MPCADEWLEWLGDEERHAGGDPVAKMQVLSLYEQAIQDYRCTRRTCSSASVLHDPRTF
jgi:hypothetical protein